ncbi:MAG: aldehyde dehydrogenase family protein, partial [bacterium]|nr:aldehyde dehydrogenase family protein [bacterium]
GLVAVSPETTLPSLAALVSGALLGGNSVILTSTEQNPRLAFLFSRIAQSTPLPRGLVTFYNASGQTSTLAGRPEFRFVAYDGTAQEGADFYQAMFQNLDPKTATHVPNFIGTPFDTTWRGATFLRQFVFAETVTENTMQHGADLAVPVDEGSGRQSFAPLPFSTGALPPEIINVGGGVEMGFSPAGTFFRMPGTLSPLNALEVLPEGRSGSLEMAPRIENPARIIK